MTMDDMTAPLLISRADERWMVCCEHSGATWWLTAQDTLSRVSGKARRMTLAAAREVARAMAENKPWSRHGFNWRAEEEQQ